MPKNGSASNRIHQLMDAVADTPDAAELEVLAILVEKYERQRFLRDAH